ncbi:unnamed protein product [Knipowitschia caucasica]|uniref:RING-type E3 ubiquitin transferase BRCA1 n=1 Tax=Knipowitschia caucasica TaxID=637954 RepID=A0AAV2LDT9_KNICA
MKRQDGPKAADVKKGISILWETLQCPICLELMTAPVSTKCDHQFCKFCMMKLLDNSKQNRASCPVCKSRVTKRSLQESPGFQKLVGGLQDMIQAYEHDTGTNYFTGQMLPNHLAVSTDAALSKETMTDEEMDDPENSCSENVKKSQSSTIKAQNGFARLMGLEDSSPLTKDENEGLDSGLGGPTVTTNHLNIITESQASQEECPTLKTRVLINTSNLPPLILEEENTQKEEDEEFDDELSAKKLSRKKHKKSSDPEKILKRRQEKSVEKVREWLLNVPNEEDIELGKPDKKAQYLDESDTFSSSSTIDVQDENYEILFGENEEPTKTLEDQVFGAVYKRAKKRNEKEVSKPTDVSSTTRLKSSSYPDPLEKEAAKEPEVPDSSDKFKGPVRMETEAQEMNEIHDVINVCQEEKVASPVPETGTSRKQRTNTRKKMLNVLEEVDIDLQEQAKIEPESTEQKKTDKRKGRLSKSSKVKSGRVAKPLDLVEVKNGEAAGAEQAKSKLESGQVQVHIENYPSSEEQDAALVKSTRRSRRLQSFVEEIKASTNKRKLKVTKSHKASDDVEVLEADTQSTKRAKINGCIYAEDLGGIEKVASGERPKILKQSLQEVPNVDTSSGSCQEQVAPDCPKTPSGDVNTVQESDIQTDPNDVQSEPKVELEEQMEEDKSDSEIDTEQLLRSFKATKRKSFHLEAPNVKRSCSLDKRNEVGEVEKTPVQDGCHAHSNSLFSDVIPPSPTMELNKGEFDVPGKAISGNCLKSSTSGALSPNKVTELTTQSPHLSIMPQIDNSGMCFTAGNRKSDSVGPKMQSTKRSHISESQRSKVAENSLSLLDPTSTKNHSPANAAQRLSNTDCSLTPDGLLTRSLPNVEEADCDESSSAQSSLQNNQRRRSRRLEPTPEVESSGLKEELPSLAQILKRDLRIGRDGSQRGKTSSGDMDKPLTDEDLVSRPPPCPSPDYVNSSQASVDLFGTPEECDVPVMSASVEMSQFSSEVLVTQQKEEMQKELVRLEKLMALVSEVLHEKENAPENNTEKSHKTQAPDTAVPQTSHEDSGLDSKNARPQSPGLSPRQRPSEAKAETQTSARDPPPDPTTDTACKDLEAAETRTASTSTTTIQNQKSRESPSEDKENAPNDSGNLKMVLVSSGLRPSEQMKVKKFAKRIGSRVVAQVTPEVTHIIMHTNEQLVCERTLKYFLGIAGRKWVVSFQWISECFKQKKLLDESLYEVKGDVVNGQNHQGAMRARTTADDHLLMRGYRVCLHGPFTAMTTEELQWMVEQCGATVVKEPSGLDPKLKSQQLVVVQSGSDISASRYNSLSRVSTVVTRGWLLDSVSTYTIHNCKNYTI